MECRQRESHERVCFLLDEVEVQQSKYYDGEFEYIEHRLISKECRISKRKELYELRREKTRGWQREKNSLAHYSDKHREKCEQFSLSLCDQMMEVMQLI